MVFSAFGVAVAGSGVPVCLWYWWRGMPNKGIALGYVLLVLGMVISYGGV